MSRVEDPYGGQLLLYGVDWRTYERLLRVFAERPSVRLTYDRGVLEIMHKTSSVQAPPGQQLVLYDVDWPMYERLLHIFAERPAVRLTYDRGVLEIMSPSSAHEGDAYLLGRFVDVVTEELGMPVKAGRSTTFRRRRKRRGLEPDNSYWIANEPRVRGKRDIDLRTDPPPDLAIEVDITHSSVDRMSIYAAFGVPEVWRLTEEGLSFNVLQPNGRYAESPTSKSFPLVTPADLTRILALRGQVDENAVVAQFRQWVRQQRQGTPPPP
jgi:Uma2 family endonuclease